MTHDMHHGCFFMNISDEAQTFEHEIDLSCLALEKFGRDRVERHEPGKNEIVTEDAPEFCAARRRWSRGRW